VEGIFHFVQLERFDDRFEFFHDFVPAPVLSLRLKQAACQNEKGRRIWLRRPSRSFVA